MHECPIDGCNRKVPDERLMCGPHWHRVPAQLQRRVYVTWGQRQRNPADVACVAEHRKACAEAVRCVNQHIQQKEASR